MKSFTRLVVFIQLLLAATAPTQAQTVYRCGNSYSQIPCEGAVTIQADDTRSDQQRNDARQALSKDKALAHELETRRKQEEAAALATARAQFRTATVQKTQEETTTVAPKTWIRTDVPPKPKKSRASKGATTPDKTKGPLKRSKKPADEP